LAACPPSAAGERGAAVVRCAASRSHAHPLSLVPLSHSRWQTPLPSHRGFRRPLPTPPTVSSLRKQGPNSKPAQVIRWVTAFAGMTRRGKAQSPEPLTNLSPRFLNVRDSLCPAHRSEIMTSGWCRGGWVARESFRARPKVPRHGPVRWPSRCKRMGCSMWGVPGRQGCAHTRLGKVGNAGSPGLSGHPRFSRCGTGCSRVAVPYAQNPDRPARREPHLFAD
jgi:hypothetical protein